MSFASNVQQWFNVEMGGSLHLPDGWYGRPYDNQHMLTAINESGSDLSITLDYNLILSFEGLQSVAPTSRELVFGPFSKLRFEWMDAQDGRRRTKDYSGGEAKIVSAPG
jgi:hypothetical protein